MKSCYHSDLIKHNTDKALDACREEVDKGVLTGFTECVLFLSGYCKHYPVRFDIIIDELREWSNQGLIKGVWEV